MRISDFAAKHGVTAKMLRHYDEIGLLKPVAIDPINGYRVYEEGQDKVIKWILILKALDFSLSEIKFLLNHEINQTIFLAELRGKRREIDRLMGQQLQKRIQIDRLIQLIEAEGFSMDKEINLLELTPDGVHEIKKHMPNTEMFLETAVEILQRAAGESYYGILRLDLNYFAKINQVFGFEVGDKVIVACYMGIFEVMEASGYSYALGRAGGDEFTVMFVAKAEAFEEIGRKISKKMTQIDFQSLGCLREVGVYVSGVYSPCSQQANLRYLIDETHFTLVKAKALGVGEILIEEKC